MFFFIRTSFRHVFLEGGLISLAGILCYILPLLILSHTELHGVNFFSLYDSACCEHE